MPAISPSAGGGTYRAQPLRLSDFALAPTWLVNANAVSLTIRAHADRPPAPFVSRDRWSAKRLPSTTRLAAGRLPLDDRFAADSSLELSIKILCEFTEGQNEGLPVGVARDLWTANISCNNND
jgi:hypothetical protein